MPGSPKTSRKPKVTSASTTKPGSSDVAISSPSTESSGTMIPNTTTAYIGQASRVAEHESTAVQRTISHDLMQQFLHLLHANLDLHKSTRTGSEQASSILATMPGSSNKTPLVRASKLACKVVREIWDSTAHKWVLTESDTLPTETTELDQFVIVDRTRVDKKYTVSSIEVKSEALRDALRDALGDMKAVNVRADKPTIERRLLYCTLPHLRTLRDTLAPQGDSDSDPVSETSSETSFESGSELELDAESDSNSRSETRPDSRPDPKSESRPDTSVTHHHLGVLIDHLEQTFRSTSDELQPLLAHGEITWKLLWPLFRPNEWLLTECPGTKATRCIRCDSGEYVEERGTLKFRVQARHFDVDGERLGEVSMPYTITKFSGRKRIRDLNIFPMQYHSEPRQIRDQLIRMGRQFIQLQGKHHQEYRGTAFTYVQGELKRINVHGRIMVDAKLFAEMNPNHWRPKVDGPVPDQGFVDLGNLQGGTTGTMTELNRDAAALREDELMCCSPTVRGFSFEQKHWLEFAVAGIEEVVWRPSSFDALVLPPRIKDVIMALAEARTGDFDLLPVDDLVAGKGQGLNFLLHGPPGVGKSATVETAAEHLRRPLYRVSAGELGTQAHELEFALTRILRLGERWQAIVLVDEADVYMEQRTPQDLVRNGLVSVLLRQLEFCQSIVFFTTNRVKAFDDAIVSRMAMLISYPEMGPESRKQVWQAFVDKARTRQGSAVVRPRDLDRLAEKEVNARQIKNAVMIAHCLASREHTRMTMAHLETAVQSSMDFQNDVKGAAGQRSMYQ